MKIKIAMPGAALSVELEEKWAGKVFKMLARELMEFAVMDVVDDYIEKVPDPEVEPEEEKEAEECCQEPDDIDLGWEDIAPEAEELPPL